MFVLEATSETQGARDDDYVWTIDGELVLLLPLDGCSDPFCGCDRGFAGMASHRATTTARIVDRPMLDEDRYRELLLDALEEQGYGLAGRELLEELVDAFVSSIHVLGEALGSGTVVGRSGGSMQIRSPWLDLDQGEPPRS